MIVSSTRDHPRDKHSMSVGTAINIAVIRAPLQHARSIHNDVSPRLAKEPDMHTLAATHPLLGTLPERERWALLDWSRLRHAARHQMIYREGEPANAVFIVLRGYARSSRTTADGREVSLEQYQHVAERLTGHYALTAVGRLAKALLDLAKSSAPTSNGRLAQKPVPARVGPTDKQFSRDCQ